VRGGEESSIVGRVKKPCRTPLSSPMSTLPKDPGSGDSLRMIKGREMDLVWALLLGFYYGLVSAPVSEKSGETPSVLKLM